VLDDIDSIPKSPWQNGYAERLIGSIRRECLDHVVVFGAQHLRRLLLSYLDYYNTARTHCLWRKMRQFGTLCTQSDASVDCIINTSGLLPVSLGMKILLSS
jgi:transposase InsO family protein